MKEKPFNFTKRFIRHELVTGSSYIFIGFFLGSIFSFLVNVFLVRNLTPSDYGVYASLLSLYTLAAIPNQSIIPIVVRFATDYFAQSEINKAADFYSRVFKFVSVLSLFIFLLFVLLSPLISNFLHLPNNWFVVLTGFSVSIVYLATVNTAFLQSILKFFFVGISYALNGLVRIVTTIVLIYFGFRVFGALGGILIAGIFLFFFQIVPLKFLFRERKKVDAKVSNEEIFRYAVPTAITTLSLMSLTSTDVILVKHFFASDIAGLYGGLSLIGKIIFYFTGPIPSVMFPLLIKRHSKGENFHNLFYLAVLLVSIPSLIITAAYFLEPRLIIGVFGKGYLEMSIYLGLFGVFLTLFSIINVFVNFFLSLKNTGVFVFVFVAAIAQIILINFFHGSILQVIFDSLYITIALLISLFVFYIAKYKGLAKPKEDISIITPTS